MNCVEFEELCRKWINGGRKWQADSALEALSRVWPSSYRGLTGEGKS